MQKFVTMDSHIFWN